MLDCEKYFGIQNLREAIKKSDSTEENISMIDGSSEFRQIIGEIQSYHNIVLKYFKKKVICPSVAFSYSIIKKVGKLRNRSSWQFYFY